MNSEPSDFRLGIITLLGLITASVIAVFAVYRWTQGAYQTALFDAGIVAALLAPVIYARRTGDSLRGGMALCVLNSAACLAAYWLIGAEALTWTYLVLLSNFFIASARFALIADLLILAVLCLLLGRSSNGIQSVSALSTAALTILFSYIFASRSRDDRVQLQEMATMDPLSGVSNRREMEKKLAHAVAERRASHRHYGLILLDVDRFKEVNDLYGHAAGDHAIADLAAILRFEMRSDDQVFRFGGEEFVVLLDVANRDDLETATERLRKAVRDSLRGPGGRITISLGAAMLGQERDWHDWFSRADAALYRAKSNGRDSYVIADDLF
ncbi:GGDEF domain-containing protein [Pseudoxanthomonas wuyuanensis]|uniref:diguanylate cyclase n=1 Tax=Pseudoxanthomonas wuyuanensis TaxID=1073196 RepID=A0A286D003_9GAMM|nr:GGDEF domain-containing protein [Pseudoxanthomonas wuyuanensis]KAF1722441.1 GGDEF domain-containing protein [Pseudoxanthomonas wuyuanensis]SOD52001.1 diguanylate cyclase (GGDEF) domain-containing protein [Pseudoxanthomonas wuyuanensis]